jgi:hypothetical protein
MGLLLELNSYGELYVILMMRLPMSVLTAAFFVTASRRIHAWWNESRAMSTSSSRSPFSVPNANLGRAGNRRWARVAVAAGVAVFMIALTVQTSLWWKRNSTGFAEWLKTPTDLKPDDYMANLQEALLWVRQNTEPDAVLVPNAFTPENMKKDHWGALDRTLMGVHFYYSAISERRLWLEGPNYALDTTRLRTRASMASAFFYRGRPLRAQTVSSSSASYVLIDHSLDDGARVILPSDNRVFANARMEVYRLADNAAADD